MEDHRVAVISGSTKFIALIGHPVGQVKSPIPLNDRFAGAGLDLVLLPVDIRPERLPDFLQAVRGMENCAGLSVTMPHKRQVFGGLDEVTERARLIEAVNVVRRDGSGRLFGDMLDGAGMMAALQEKGFPVRGKSVLVVGAGGAGAAIIDALVADGAARIVLAEVDGETTRSALASLRRRYPDADLGDDIAAGQPIDIAINATPVGMNTTDPHPYPLDRLDKVSIVADAVTKPAVTPWLEAARARGIEILPGADMTLAQLDMQVAFWGVPAATRDRP